MPLDSENLILLALIGFGAQLIDGAIGMAYGVVSNSFLLSVGIPPASASAVVHTAEIFMTLASGVSHLKLGNVNKSLFSRLVIPGVLGGATGAYILSSAPTDFMKVVVSLYLLLTGVAIVIKTVKFAVGRTLSSKGISLLGGIGGFLDAIGGGGWGPIVTSTLIVGNYNPRLAIGSVNLAEFFVTIVESVTFLIVLGSVDLRMVLGLVSGGLVAAPIAAYACKKAPTRVLMALVGLLLIVLSLRNLKILSFQLTIINLHKANTNYLLDHVIMERKIR